MEKKPSPSLPGLSVVWQGALLALVGWAAVAALVNFTVPFLFPRWLFYFCLVVALTGTALPLVWYLNRRFSPERFHSEGVLWREGMEVAGLLSMLIWLQVGRILNAALGWIFFIVLLAVEILLRIYENSRWTPANQKNEQGSIADSVSESAVGVKPDQTTQ